MRITVKQMKEAVKKHAELTARIAILSAEKEELTKLLKQAMKDKSLNEFVAGEYKALYNEFTSSKFDRNAFKEAHPRMFNKFTYTTNQERLVVNLNK